jgi:glycosyltransferase involved in cell wall biosynthesis
VIPCYNDAEFLGPALDTVRRQTREPLEVLVVDDGSEDDSRAIARARGAKVLRNAGRRGPGGARNTGIMAARGDIVALLDSDDLWDETHLEEIASLLDRFPAAAAAFTDAQLFGTHTNTWYMMIPPFEVRDCYFENLLKTVALPSATAGRTAVLRQVLFDDSLPAAEDHDFLVRLSRDHRMVRSDRVTVHYRKQPGRRSRKLNDALAVQMDVLVRECRRASRSGDAGFDRRVHERALEVLTSKCLEFWGTRDSEGLTLIIRHGARVPGSDRVLPRWGLWLRLLPIARIWDSLPPWVRRLVRAPSPIRNGT